MSAWIADRATTRNIATTAAMIRRVATIGNDGHRRRERTITTHGIELTQARHAAFLAVLGIDAEQALDEATIGARLAAVAGEPLAHNEDTAAMLEGIWATLICTRLAHAIGVDIARLTLAAADCSKAVMRNGCRTVAVSRADRYSGRDGVIGAIVSIDKRVRWNGSVLSITECTLPASALPGLEGRAVTEIVEMEWPCVQNVKVRRATMRGRTLSLATDADAMAPLAA